MPTLGYLPLGGGEGNRTPGLFDATEALYQLSYTPEGVLRLPRGGVVAERGTPGTAHDGTGTSTGNPRAPTAGASVGKAGVGRFMVGMGVVAVVISDAVGL